MKYRLIPRTRTRPVNSSNSKEKIEISNNPTSTVTYSGNSDVDVNVVVDTTPLAYVLATYLYVDGRLTQNKYNELISELGRHFGTFDGNSTKKGVKNNKWKNKK
ncbi:hypothetical protein J2S74_001762 [Evansella vedderi]|uniref:Uncharacterized protein n=1 Tax=Evansella vedderi TaxID=38282 RepID=A0ABT9ZT24_9BACI|nr:hypothetical protein [Evansella vedderi]MDQ0254387.1 hypothetical protein [Evansella vedderi]